VGPEREAAERHPTQFQIVETMLTDSGFGRSGVC
jgi:hypothetical protein